MKILRHSIRALTSILPKSVRSRLFSSTAISHIAKSPAKKVKPLTTCVICRKMDTFAEEQRIVRLLLSEAATAGVKVYKLPSETGLRYGVAQGARSSFISKLRRECEARGVEHATTEKTLKNNFYEFDQVQFTSPEQATTIVLYPKPHCNVGKVYLPSRAITLDLLEQRIDSIIVPTPGQGPRIISMDRAERAAINQDENGSADWPFPIDLVYTWVDTDDEIWKKNYESVAGVVEQYSSLTASTNAARWYSRDELKYSLRSVEMYAAFIRKIFIVTNGQVPKWLAPNDKIQVISHEQLYPDVGVLPTFNSNHIESVLHNIPGLAEHFLYLNDDFFFARRCYPSDFFTPGGLGKIFYSERHLDDRPVGENDRATVAAHKNSRELLLEKFGQECHRKFQHAPYVMRKSTWDAIERDFPQALATTRSHRFRSREDINGQFLYAHYAALSGTGFAGKIEYSYFDVQDIDLLDRVGVADQKKVKVFCLNDANSTEENVAASDAFIFAFFEGRFPNPSSFESSASQTKAARAVNLTVTDAMEGDIRELGAVEVEMQYLQAFNSGNVAAAKNLYRLYYNQNRIAEAAQLAGRSNWSVEEKLVRRIDALSKGTIRTTELVDDLSGLTVKNRKKVMGYLVRTVETAEDLEAFRRLLEKFEPNYRKNSASLQLFAGAARRANDAPQAIELLEDALRLAKPYPKSQKDNRRDAQQMKKPAVVLADLFDIAGPDAPALFLDAGTLLGCVREGDFIGHDYDIDLSIRDPEAFARIRERMLKDWRFNVARVRTPDLLIQAKHIDGTNIDIFHHQPTENGWEKRSHVFGWHFNKFELGPSNFKGLDVQIPTPPEPYLEQMYGTEWRVPIAGFDSRLVAPNCYFPDHGEIVCTLLNKAVDAARYEDTVTIEKNREFLRDELNYEMPKRD